jgi:hypothetical protein
MAWKLHRPAFGRDFGGSGRWKGESRKEGPLFYILLVTDWQLVAES